MTDNDGMRSADHNDGERHADLRGAMVKESVLSCAEPSDPSDCEVQLGPGPEWSGLRHLVVTLGAASARTSGLAQPHHQAARRRFERGAVNHLDLPRLAPRDTPRTVLAAPARPPDGRACPGR